MRDRQACLFAAGMGLAVVLNALPFYLRRIGVIDPVAYGRELARFCSGPIQHWWLPASCHAYRLVSTVPRQFLRIDPTRLYQIRPRPFAWCKTRGPIALIRG